ncbi:MAG: T9SS type A sorting domain-containing protein [Stygiobacter sp.]
MNPFYKSLILILIIVKILTMNSNAQTALYSFFENGQWKVISSTSLITQTNISNQIIDENNKAGKFSLVKSSSRFKLLFQRDSADAFNPGLYAYTTKGGWNAMDIGNGKKAIVMSVLDTAIGRVTTYYYSPTSFQPLATIVDMGYHRVVVGTQTANMQMTGSADLEHIVFYGSAVGGSGPPLGTTQTRVLEKFSGQNLFTGTVSTSVRAFYYPIGFLEESKTNFDLTGNGLFEILGTETYGGVIGGGGNRVYVYDNLALIDTINDRRTSLFSAAFTTCNDANSDGRPEVVITVSNIPNLYQWNATNKKFELLRSLGYSRTLWAKPENVDGEPTKELIIGGGHVIDTLVIYDASLNTKYRLSGKNFIGTSFFVDNVNNTSNKEIIITGPLFGTIVYDLSIGTTPIWSDPKFFALAVGDFRKIGHSDILGTYKSQDIKTLYTNLRLVDGSSGFKPVWTRNDSLNFFDYRSFTGAHAPSNFVSLDLFSALSLSFTTGIARYAPADCNGDAINDFVVQGIDKKNSRSIFLVINANGEIIDTLPNVRFPAYALAHDFNGNGKAELLVSQYIPSISFTPQLEKKTVYVFEYDGVTELEHVNETPSQFILGQNYPNPFNPKTNFDFNISELGLVTFKIYNVIGQEVATLVNEELKPGAYKVSWNASGFASGIYLYTLTFRGANSNFISTKKMVYLR